LNQASPNYPVLTTFSLQLYICSFVVYTNVVDNNV